MDIKELFYYIANNYCWHILSLLMMIGGIIFELKDERSKSSICFLVSFVFAYFIHIF